MESQNYIPQSKRQSAHECAVIANENYHKAKEANLKYLFWNDKSKILDRFNLNSKMYLFLIIYTILIAVDAKIMQPIIEVVVQHGFQIEKESQVILFIIMYVILVIAFTLGVSSRLASLIDSKLFEIQAEFEKASNPNEVLAIVKDNLYKKEKTKALWSALFGIFLVLIVVSLSLFRNYLMNDFVIKMNSPDDWINIILPISIILALCYFGVYKDIFVKRLEILHKKKKYYLEQNSSQSECDKYTKLAVEQNDFANQYLENTSISEELKYTLYRYNTKSIIDDDYYDEVKNIEIKLSGKNHSIEGIQIFAITGDDITLHMITNKEGNAIINWKTDSNFIKFLRVGTKVVPGSLWYNGDSIYINLDDLNGLKLVPA